jgi:hypothetical protein
MKYLKKINELFKYKLQRGELIFADNYSSSRQIYLILKCEKSISGSNIITAFHIGNISIDYRAKEQCSLCFNIKKNQIFKFNVDITPLFLSEKEKILVCEAIDKDISKLYLDIIKEKTNIDLRETEEYKNYLIDKEAKKYNL